jgi:Sulfotransferase domain
MVPGNMRRGEERVHGEHRSRASRGDPMSAGDKSATATRLDASPAGVQRPAGRWGVIMRRPSRPHDPRLLGAATKRAARAAVLTASLPTSSARMLPSFLIVGAQRGGTTSMCRTLSQHPAVFGSLLQQEVHYFDNAYGRGLGWYRCNFPFSARARREAERGAGAAPMGFESSPYYMFHPLASARIARDLPGVKLLVLLRDPVERAYSGHAHEVAHGFETEPFQRALELEPVRLDGEEERIIAEPGYVSYSHQHHSYRARGHYAEQLERLAVLFGRERIHVMDSGDFFLNPERVYDGVLAFLGLPKRGYPVFKRRNARPRPVPMPKAVRAALEEHYRPHDERLATWLGNEPSWRR